MDIASIVGMLGMVTLNLIAMEDPVIFWNTPSALFVFGGTIMLILFSFTLQNVGIFGRYCWYAVVPPKANDDVEKVRNDLEMGILMLDRAKTFLQATGLVGTMIGAILMLKDMSDLSAVAPATAVTILTAFYGIIVAYFFCLPIKTKLQVHLRNLDRDA
jgi:flagellar motor component MotA